MILEVSDFWVGFTVGVVTTIVVLLIYGYYKTFYSCHVE